MWVKEEGEDLKKRSIVGIGCVFGLTVILFNLWFLLIEKAMLRAELWVEEP